MGARVSGLAFGPERNWGSYRASENSKRGTSADEPEVAREGMDMMSEVYRGKGEWLYLPDGRS